MGDRLEIKILLNKGYSCRAIARSMGRSPNTIAYEIEVNGGKVGYDPNNANIYARVRKRNTRREWSKIEQTPALKTYIISGLKNHWNPDEISGEMKKCLQDRHLCLAPVSLWSAILCSSLLGPMSQEETSEENRSGDDSGTS